MNTDTIKLFDSNNNLLDNYDITVEQVLVGIYGEDYYDLDEDYTETSIEPIELPKSKEMVKSKKKISIKDFVPVLFFILIFTILIVGGYYFLNNIDLGKFIS